MLQRRCGVIRYPTVEAMRFKRSLAASLVGLLSGCLSSAALPQDKPANPAIKKPPVQGAPPSAKESKPPGELIEKINASKQSLEKLLAVYQRQLQSQSAELELRKKWYEENLISRLELQQSERSLSETSFKIEQVQRWIAENDIALNEAFGREELERLPPLPAGGYSETVALIRYNGRAVWSLTKSEWIEKFFVERFGRPLPVSARGQTLAHERMRFDHRDALDVAVHPDSVEGRALMGHLRKAGIPFIAFRGKMAGSATGAHIHIGRPSIRLLSASDGASSLR